MLAIYASTALILLASLADRAGDPRAARLAAGRRDAGLAARPDWLSGAVGFAALVTVTPFLLRLPGRATTTAILLGLVLIAAAVVVWRDPERGRPDWPAVATLADRRRPRLAALPRQRPGRGARRGHLHQRPRRAALLVGLAPARLRPRAERGPLRLSDRPAGGRRGRRAGDRGEPRQLLQRAPARDPGAHGADRARRPRRDAGAAADRDRRDHRASLSRGLVPRPERLQGDRDGAVRARLRARPADGGAHRRPTPSRDRRGGS